MPNNTAISPLRTYRNYSPTLGDRVYIDASAVVIGDVDIGSDSSIWPTAVIRGDMHRIHIGARTNIQDGAILHITHDGPFSPGGFPLTIGDDVTIGHSVNLHGCKIGNRVLIGIGSTILDGAIIEDDVVIGAGSLVPPGKHLAGESLYFGNPCQLKRTLSEKEKEFFLYSSKNYVGLKDQYLNEER